jgi:hypothetical protein
MSRAREKEDMLRDGALGIRATVVQVQMQTDAGEGGFEFPAAQSSNSSSGSSLTPTPTPTLVLVLAKVDAPPSRGEPVESRVWVSLYLALLFVRSAHCVRACVRAVSDAAAGLLGIMSASQACVVQGLRTGVQGAKWTCIRVFARPD